MTLERIAELIPQALTGYYGHKCKDFDDNCICCQAWAELSRLTRERDEAFNAGIDAAARVAKSFDYSFQSATALDVLAIKISVAIRALLKGKPNG